MRIAIVSDIHANLAAFEAVIAHAKSVGYDSMICLGDVVGYGPDPLECVDLVRATCQWSLLGNHDFAALYEPTNFNPVARNAAFWTRDQVFAGADEARLEKAVAELDARRAKGELDAADFDRRVAMLRDPKSRIDFLFSISPRHVLLDRYICVHGSPTRPVNEYLFPTDAEQNAHRIERSFRMLTLPSANGTPQRVSALVGHTHVPGFFLEDREFADASSGSSERNQVTIEWVGVPPELDAWTPGDDEMPVGMRFILNPGSVGQPRDRDPRASYAMLETGATGSPDRFTFHRVPYDIARTQEKLFALREAGADLDPWLAERLELGQ
ncbi:MAG: metallophosphoesterase family protein [Phycisphaerales bacterium]|jgi:predicted phosphodiesterase